MRVAGVVCECNPYHSGHKKLIEKAVEHGAERLVAVMSGDFVQRGEPALLSKFDRAADLAEQGFSLVFELPVRYSLSSSERFAAASVGLLDHLGTIDTLLFGSESGDLDLLSSAASAVDDESVQPLVSGYCNNGLSYPSALTEAVRDIYGDDIAGCMSSPNNILAIDYLRAITALGSGMVPLTLCREDDGMNAHSVRDRILRREDVSGMVTERTAGLVNEGDILSVQKWETVALASLRNLKEEQTSMIPDVSGGLDRRMLRASREAVSLDDFYDHVKTKNYTMSRIKRATACAVCGISGLAGAVPPYARLLAIGKGGRDLLGEISRSSRIPISENLAVLAETSGHAASLAAEEERATDIYNIIRQIPRPAGEDRNRRLFVTD